MTTDNNTGKDKEFYNWGKMIFDRIQPEPEPEPEPNFAELEKIMLEVWQPVQQEQALQRMTDNAEELGLYKREWVGLTDEEVSKIIDAEIGFNACWGPEEDFAKAIEAKLKEKNNG